MGTRREARERAVQFLFQHDLNPPANLDEALNHFWDSQRNAALAEDMHEFEYTDAESGGTRRAQRALGAPPVRRPG